MEKKYYRNSKTTDYNRSSKENQRTRTMVWEQRSHAEKGLNSSTLFEVRGTITEEKMAQ